MFNSSKYVEGNLGFGFHKKIHDNWAVGTYAFYDYRRTDFNFQQINFGAEIFSEHFEIRANGYVPIFKKEYIQDSVNVSFSENATINQSTLSITKTKSVTVAMHGFDLEIGGMFSKLSRFRIYTAYYQFSNKNFPTIRGKFKLSNILYLIGETSYDKVRKSINYVGLNFSISIGKRQQSSLTQLEKMMTWLPTIDVDIVTKEN